MCCMCSHGGHLRDHSLVLSGRPFCSYKVCSWISLLRDPNTDTGVKSSVSWILAPDTVPSSKITLGFGLQICLNPITHWVYELVHTVVERTGKLFLLPPRLLTFTTSSLSCRYVFCLNPVHPHNMHPLAHAHTPYPKQDWLQSTRQLLCASSHTIPHSLSTVLSFTAPLFVLNPCSF